MLFLTLYKLDNDIQYEYSIHDIQKSLFNLHNLNVVSRENGRLTREVQYTFETQAEKDKKIQSLFNKKMNQGYKVLYTFPKQLDQIIKENTG